MHVFISLYRGLLVDAVVDVIAISLWLVVLIHLTLFASLFPIFNRMNFVNLFFTSNEIIDALHYYIDLFAFIPYGITKWRMKRKQLMELWTFNFGQHM